MQAEHVKILPLAAKTHAAPRRMPNQDTCRTKTHAEMAELTRYLGKANKSDEPAKLVTPRCTCSRFVLDNDERRRAITIASGD